MSKIQNFTALVCMLSVANAWGAGFMDDFNRPDGDLGNDWATQTNGTIEVKIVDNEVLIEGQQATDWTRSGLHRAVEDETKISFDFKADNSFNVHIRIDDADTSAYIDVYAWPGGPFSYASSEDGGWPGWTEIAGSNMIPGEYNSLTLEQDGTEFILTLNDTVVGTVTNANLPNIGSVLISCDSAAGTSGSLHIDNVQIGGVLAQQTAKDPSPEDGALYLDTWVSLVWKAGDFALSHDVYFGDNFDDVNDGIGDTFRGNQASANYIVGFPGFAFPDGLVPGVTYYWRIDEVNDADPNSPWKGNVWSFTIPPKKAYDPIPPDGSMFENPDAELSWESGFGAKLHYIYFGDNFDDVNNATVGIPSALNTYNPGTLELEKFYYWRIDEFDGFATHKGDVWRFRTLPVIPIFDPSLVGWWTLDEGVGTTVVDWSGHGNHGTFQGDPQWVAGQIGGALEFDGSGDWVTTGLMPADFGLDGDNAKTVTAWVYTRGFDNGGIYDMGSQSNGQEFCLRTMTVDNDWRIQCWGFSEGFDHDFTYPTLDRWVHFAHVYDGTSTTLYANGEQADFYTKTLDTANAAFVIGRYGSNTGFNGIIDDLRLFNKALTQEEVMQAMRGDPLAAWGPNPANGSTLYIRDATPLSWSPGDNASGHDVYFGIDRDAVADADASDTTGIYRGRQGVTIYTPPDVEWGGGPYYWRVDEYNTDATISKGNVWSFTVTDFLGIDDIEDYNDYPPDEIFSTWIDGWEVPTNGSMAGHANPPFAETGNVHGGSQSMPVYYENNFKYSEITMTLVYPRNWTEEGVGVLSLWFCGDAANAAERMYVALNGNAVVYHDNPDAALIEEWTEWTINLQEFAAQGVNLANVNTITIGFGDKNNLQAGGSGIVFFDDIRLYRPAPEPETAP